MIHTDGRPTIANCGPVPGVDCERAARLEQLARDVAAVYGCSLEEARARLTGAKLADTLTSDESALD